MVLFNVDEVNRLIATSRFAGCIKYFQSVSSTNVLASEAAQSGTQEGVWVADEQTAGRGRGNHSWHSAAGDGLYVSLLVRPNLPPASALYLSLATGLAAKAAIAEISAADVDIRWPNDLLLGSKKCGGILVETALTPEHDGTRGALRYAVIGIGLNLNHTTFPEELSPLATSIRIATGQTISRETTLAVLLQHLEQELRMLESESPPSLLARFTSASSWACGKRVHVSEVGGYTGITAGLDERGFLMVDADDGRKRTVVSGGVREA